MRELDQHLEHKRMNGTVGNTVLTDRINNYFDEDALSKYVLRNVPDSIPSHPIHPILSISSSQPIDADDHTTLTAAAAAAAAAITALLSLPSFLP